MTYRQKSFQGIQIYSCSEGNIILGISEMRSIFSAFVLVSNLITITGCVEAQKAPVRHVQAQAQEKAWRSHVAKVLQDYIFAPHNSKGNHLINRLQELERKWTRWKSMTEFNMNYSKNFSDDIVSQSGMHSQKHPTYESQYSLLAADSDKSSPPNRKGWAKLVDKFLSELVKGHLVEMEVTSFLKFSKETTGRFLQASSTTHKVFRKRKDCFTANKITVPLGTIQKQENIAHSYFSIEHYRCDPCLIKLFRACGSNVWPKYFSHRHAFIFTLSKELKLSLQFHTIHIELVDLHLCEAGFLTLSSELADQPLFAVKFCGIHSNIPVYPPFHDVRIASSLWLWVSHNLIFTFDILSSENQIVTLSDQGRRQNKTGCFTISNKNKLFDLIRIETAKSNVIHLKFNLEETSIDVFDGPGVLSPKTSITSRADFFTSTFQCQVVLLTAHSGFGNWSKRGMSYIYLPNPNFHHIHLHSNSSAWFRYPGRIHLSNDTEIDADDNILVLTIQADLNINISINMLQSEFTQNSLCNYGGIAMYKENKNTRQQLSVLLCSHDETRDNKNFYFQGPDCLLVLYSYPEYAAVTTELTVSLTSCSVTTPTAFKPKQIIFPSSPGSPHQNIFCAVLLLGIHAQTNNVTNTTKMILNQKGSAFYHRRHFLLRKQTVNTFVTANISVRGSFEGLCSIIH